MEGIRVKIPVKGRSDFYMKEGNILTITDDVFDWLNNHGGAWQCICGSMDDYCIFIFPDTNCATMFKLAWGGR